MIVALLTSIIVSPAEDPRLAAPEKLAIVMEPVADALGQLAKKKGCALEVAGALLDRKVAIHTEKEPLGQTLTRVAQVMDAKWTATAAGWRLDPISERMTEMATYLKLRDDLLLSEARTSMEAMGKLAARPFPEVSAEAERARKAGAAEKDPERAKAYFARWHELGAGDYMSFLGGALYRTLKPVERQKLWQGEMFVGSTAAGSHGHPLPPGAENWSEEHFQEPLERRGDTRIFARYHPTLGQLQYRVLRESQNGYRMITPIPYVASELLEKHPFAARQTAWHDGKAFAAFRAKPATKLPPAGKGRYQRGFWSTADVLARLHARTGLPIVAMVTRDAYDIADPDKDIRTGAESIEPAGTIGAALAAYSTFGAVSLHESGGFLLARSSRWAEALRNEPPEPLVRAFEAIETPTLDDCATLAARLDDRQAYALGRPDEIVCLKDATPLSAFSIEALRLWGSLGPAQKSTLLKGGPVGAASLSAVQLRGLEQAVIGAVLTGAPVPDVMRRYFDGVDQDAVQGLSIWATIQPVQESHVMPPRTSSQTYHLDLAMKPGLVLKIGPTPKDGIEISFATPPSP